MKPSSISITRRQFVKRTAVAATALTFPFIASRNVLGANERLNIAGIGVGGKGASDVANVDSENIVALCDVDDSNAAETFKKYPHAKRYKDFRVMLEQEGRQIDAVTVSTPDHMHAPAAVMAMKMRKHVYCQKPLTHTVYEARVMAEVARKYKVATQMGNQGHSNPETRRLVELIQAGALGDMACHNMDLPFFSLKLRDPISIEAQSSEVNEETAPSWSIITYEFPRQGDHPPVKMVWYDGGKKPSAELVKGQKLPENGVIMIGDKDILFVPSYWGGGSFLSGAKVEDFKSVPQTLPRLPGFEKNHHQEWINACKGGAKALSNFDYSGPMTEAVLLGNVALRTGRKIEWDAKKLKVTNLPEANRYLRSEYRKGWHL